MHTTPEDGDHDAHDVPAPHPHLHGLEVDWQPGEGRQQHPLEQAAGQDRDQEGGPHHGAALLPVCVTLSAIAHTSHVIVSTDYPRYSDSKAGLHYTAVSTNAPNMTQAYFIYIPV